MIAEKIWKLREQQFSKKKIKNIKSYHFSEEMAKILLLRGLDTKEKIDSFINCSFEHFHDPFLLPDIDKFFQRIKQALEQQESILVYGDYDVDGTVSSSILTRALKKIGIKNILTMAPHRKLGYGLKEKIIPGIKRKNISLIITCDCGSSDSKAIELAKTLGIDTIVIDHHEVIKDVHPFAFINPKRKDSQYPFKELCGAGIVFKIVQAMEKYYPQVSAVRCIEYIAIATVADVCTLVDENRIIVKYGMERLSRTKNVPLVTILESLSLTMKINSEIIGFVIAPRLNAPGRISSANLTIKFLLCDDKQKSVVLFKKINSLNEKRKIVEKEIKENAIELLKNRLNDKVIVLSSKNWNKGVIGIVASVICKYYTRPTILISIENGIGYGSIRNIEEFPLLESLEKCQDLLKGFGGHTMAAGISIKEENIDNFRIRINQIADSILNDDELVPSTKADLILNGKEISLEFIKELQTLEPFGNGNEIPKFILQDVMVVDHTIKDRHLNLKVVKGTKTFNVPAFWMDEYDTLIKEDVQEFDILFELNENVFKNYSYVQLLLEDLKTCKLI